MGDKNERLKNEYPNKCHMRDVKNSEKHPRIAEVREKPKKIQKSEKSTGGDDATASRRSGLEGKNSGENEVTRSSQDTTHHLETDSGKKKKRKTEQEKLIASLNETELPHVDGAFKRSTTIRYNNLNEDKLFDKMLETRMVKPKRSSGKKLLCLDVVTGLADSAEMDKVVFGETKNKKLVADEAETVEPIQVEVKKKRKTEKEKLIESLSAIERIHVDGAFKRNVFNKISLNMVGGGNSQVNVSNVTPTSFANNNNNNVIENIGGSSWNKKTGRVFSPVKFVSLEDDIESLIKGKVTERAT